MTNNMKRKTVQDPLLKSETIEVKHKPDHLFLKFRFAVLLLILTLLIDSGVVTNLVTLSRIKIGLDFSGLGGLSTVAGTLLVLDVLIPAFMFLLKREIYEVDTIPRPFFIAGIIVVMIFVGCMFAVRWSFVTLETIEDGSATYAQAVLYSMLPLGTSLLSTALFWGSYDPIGNKMKYYEQLIFSEQEKRMSVRAEIAKYAGDAEDYRDRLMQEENLRYTEKYNEIIAISRDLKAHARLTLATMLADPLSASNLGRSVIEAEVIPVLLPERQQLIQSDNERGETK